MNQNYWKAQKKGKKFSTNSGRSPMYYRYKLVDFRYSFLKFTVELLGNSKNDLLKYHLSQMKNPREVSVELFKHSFNVVANRNTFQ